MCDPVSIVTSVATVASGAMASSSQSRAGRRAADAQTQASQAEIALQREQYQDTRNLSRPVAEAGNSARARQMLMQGMSPEEVRSFLSQSQSAWAGGPGGVNVAPTDELRTRYPDLYAEWTNPGTDGIAGNMNRTPNFADFVGQRGMNTAPTQSTPGGGGSNLDWVDNWTYESSSPSYDFRLNQGTQALERSAAARGRLFSGATGRALQEYGQNFASQEFENDFNRLGALSGAGTNAQNMTINAGQNYANQAGNALQNAGNARASGYLAQGNAQANFWGNTVPGALGSFGGFGKWGGWGGGGGGGGGPDTSGWGSGFPRWG
jgi:hypothetical protein